MGEGVGRGRGGRGLDAGGEVDQGLHRLGGEVVGEVEEGVLGGGADVGEPVGRDAAEEERRLGGAGEERRAGRGDGDGDDDLLDALADLDELGGAGGGVDLEAAALGPGVGGVVVADPGEEGVGAALVQDDAAGRG